MSKVINAYSLNDYLEEIKQAIMKYEESGVNRRNLIIVVNGTYYWENDILNINEVKSIYDAELTIDNTLPKDMIFTVIEKVNYLGFKHYQKMGIHYDKYCNTLKIPKVEIKGV